MWGGFRGGVYSLVYVHRAGGALRMTGGKVGASRAAGSVGFLLQEGYLNDLHK